MIYITQAQKELLDAMEGLEAMHTKNVCELLPCRPSVTVKLNLQKLYQKGAISKQETERKRYPLWAKMEVEYKVVDKRRLKKGQDPESFSPDKKPKKRVKRPKIKITKSMLPIWPAPRSAVDRCAGQYPSYRQ